MTRSNQRRWPAYNNSSFTEDHGVTEADLDYSLQLANAQSLKIGYAFEKDDYAFDNVGATGAPATGLETVDPALTNETISHESIHAIYQSYQASAGVCRRCDGFGPLRWPALSAHV